MRKYIQAAVLSIGFILLCSGAMAAKPSQTIEKYIDKVISELQTTAKGSENKDMAAELEKRLHLLAREIFDFKLMARMSLASYWNDLNDEQQKQFVDLFIQLLENNYFQKLEKYLEKIKDYSRDDVVITEEIIFSERKSEVQTIIKYEEKKIPVNYRLVSTQSAWKVYDIYVEGVSLVQNYRSQFKEILLDNSPEQMLDLLKNKVEKGSEISD